MIAPKENTATDRTDFADKSVILFRSVKIRAIRG
jgi:hypothetical protein